MKYELRNYSFGQTIGKGFNLFFDNFLYVVGISLIFYTPLFYLNFFSDTFEIEGSNVTYYYGQLYYIIIGFFLSALTLKIVSKKYLGINISIKNYYLINPDRLFPLLVLAFVFILISIPLNIVDFYYTIDDPYFTLAFLPVIITTIFVTTVFSVSDNVLIMEGVSAIESLKRSWQLTKGKRWPISGLILLFLAFDLLKELYIIDFIAENYPIAYGISDYLLISLTDPIMDCIFVVVYFNLRVEKEGFNVEHLAEQFSLTDDRE